MLRKCYDYIGSRYIGSRCIESRYIGRRYIGIRYTTAILGAGRPGPEHRRAPWYTRVRASWKLRAGSCELEAASWKLRAAYSGAASCELETSCELRKELKIMWAIGAGIAMGGFVSLVFAPVWWCIVAILGGILIAIVTDWCTLQKESKHNEWRKAYPTYKY